MTMNALFVKWVIFVTLINSDFHYCQNIRFRLMSPAQTAMEGSCIEIKCDPLYPDINGDAYWFWMKDANWTKEMGYVGTTIFSSNEAEHPVSPEFKNRVNYLSSTRSGRRVPSKVCNILICDLKKTDSGQYMFRYVFGTFKWTTKNFNLTVRENPCLITFSQPPTVMTNNNVTLTCSTSISCNSDPQINPLEKQPSPKWLSSHNIVDKNETTKSTNRSFTASWTDDGRMFSCQTTENKDKYLTRSVTLTVEYSPNNVVAKISHQDVKEGDYVTLTCSANGRPDVTFSWFKNGKQIQEGQLNFTSIKESASGSYFCQAQNKHGTNQSNTLQITVLYPPSVQIQLEPLTRRHNTDVKEGDKIKLTCGVNRSNPQPKQFAWFKAGQYVRGGNEFVFFSIKPEDSGAYECTAKNSVGLGRSNSFHLNVQYKPQSTVSTSATDKVKVNSFLRFTCDTKANPEPWFSWYRYKQSDPTNWTPLNIEKDLTLQSVQRADEGCYICNASNTVGSGKSSQPKCFQVLFPPTNISLFMGSKVKEGQSITMSCNAESFPLSTFELQKSSERFFSQPANEQNSFTHTFNVTSTHAGLYTCIASNSEGSGSSNQRKLEVEYAPKDVRIDPNPGENVKENESFSLTCNAKSNPLITQFKWIRRNNDKDITVSTEKTFTVHSSKPSDSGLYICEVQNVIGSGKSQVKINIKYAPKWTTITKGEEQQHSGGRSSVTLSCSSHSYPPANYNWYNKTDNTRVSGHQNITVYSHQPGEYYCTARNEMGQIKSDSVSLFDDTFMKIMKAVGCIFLILLILGLIFLYRHRMNKANRQRTTNRWPCCNFLLIIQGFCSLCKRPKRRNARNENILTDTSRSRDDLLPQQHCHPLPQQHCRPKAQHQQPRPDVTSTSHHVNVVYSTVNVPYGKQAPSAQRPGGSLQTCAEDDSLNYASLHFPKKKKEEVESVYSQVSKPNPCKQEKLDDYENVNMASPIKIPYNFDDDSETSDEEEVNYTKVDIIPKPSSKTDSSDSSDSSTSEDETQYSDIKL